MANRAIRLIQICSLLMISGCHLISPNISIPEPTFKLKGADGKPIAADCSDVAITPVNDDNLDRYNGCAIDYAKKAREAYASAGNEYSTVPGALETMLVPVGGAALALGIEGYSGAPVTGLGVGAGSLLGMGTLYQHKDRETVYNTGALAVDCLLGNMQPYTNVTTVDLKRLYKTLYGDDGLVRAKGDLERKLADFERVVVSAYCGKSEADQKIISTEQKTISDVIKAAQAADKAADSALKSGSDFLGTTYASPATIIHTVYSINDSVTKALIKTEPDVQSLAGTMKGVIPDSVDALAGIKAASSDSAKAASTQAAALNSGSSGTKAMATFLADKQRPAEDFETLYSALYDSILNVNDLNSQVLQIVGTATKPPDNKSCVALTEQAKEPKVLTLKPSGDIKVAQGDKATVAIKGVTTKASVYPLFAQSPVLKSEVIATLSDTSLEVAAESGTNEGFYPFVVMDGPTGEPFNVLVVKKQSDDFFAGICKKVTKPPPPRHRWRYSCRNAPASASCVSGQPPMSAATPSPHAMPSP
jgi:hypothetical protein